MARFRRINIDGKSLYKTETRLLLAAAFPGTVQIINADDKFAVGNGTVGSPRLYLLDENAFEGLDCMTQIPAGHTAIGNYIEDDREFAVRMAAGTYRKDQSVYVNATGQVTLVPATAGTYRAIGYVQEQDEVTTTDVDLIRIRVQFHTITNS
jgi:hypothetical protein